ncbi:MAG TPA: helix-turn-helix domain-containing protein [Nocardioidaceae bacterium]|nr:helix-turn-helix domain-containing protein [Nocardioidaceae bacterium]
MPNVRQTSADIDRAIIDVAAGMFARHGYAQTSLAHVAAEVGYSKAGLIKRFGNKEGLFSAIVDAGVTIADAVVAASQEMPEGRERQRLMLVLSMEVALDHVGLMELVLNSFEAGSDLPAIEVFQLQAIRMIGAGGFSVDTPAEAMRTALALQMLVNAVRSQSLNAPFDLTMPRNELVAYAVDLALHTLTAPVAPQAL